MGMRPYASALRRLRPKRHAGNGADILKTMTMNYRTEIINSIIDLVKIDSSQQPAQAGKPFGEGAAEALGAFLSLAKRLGFATRNYDNYIGEALFGEGEPFAVLCHLDVVPAGEGWTHPHVSDWAHKTIRDWDWERQP